MAVRVDLHRAPVDRIRTMARDAPELAILAACIKQALEDAQAGDLEAAEWLASPECQSMLSWLIPEHADVAAVHTALLARLRTRKFW